MIKINFTKNIVFKLSALVFLLCISGMTMAQDDPCDIPAVSSDLATNPLVIISLDGDCEAAISPDQILEGDFPCYDHFRVVFDDTEDTPAIVTSAHVNAGDIAVRVELLDADGLVISDGWGNIRVEDKVDPIITCPCEETPEDCELTCVDLDAFLADALVGVAEATAVDGCGGEPTITHEDEVTVDGGDCEVTEVTRTYTATDASGNTASCEAVFTFRPLTFDDVSDYLPGDLTDDLALECGDDVPDPVSLLKCNMTISLNGDEGRVDICDGTYKIIRNYIVTDWCADAPDNIMYHTQTIKVEDTEAPDLTCPADLTVGTTSNACVGNAVLERPSYTDCSGSVTMTPTSSTGSVSYDDDNDEWTVAGLEPGANTITWTVEDACGNSNECSYEIYVEDNFAPVPVCDLHTKVGLGSSASYDDPTLVEAITFDDGSTDNCGIVSYEVRRMNSPACPGPDGTGFGPVVPFYCCDIGTTVMVELRVKDAAGNVNSCMVEVEVEDKIDPVIFCPADKVVECGADISIDALGEATATDNCSVTVTHVDIGDLDDCGIGRISRIWTATDAGGRTASCVQSIDVVNSDPFTITDTECRRYLPLGLAHSFGDDVEWPCDIEIGTCGLGLHPNDLDNNGATNPETNQPINLDARPTIFETSCQNIAVTHQDTELDFGADDACLKLLRKWIIIDWCQVNDVSLNGPNPDPTDDATTGVWHYVQVIKVVNSEAPEVLTFDIDIADINDFGTTDDGAYLVGNVDNNCGATFVGFNITVDDDCTENENLDVSYAFNAYNHYTGELGAVLSSGSLNLQGLNTYSVSDAFNNGYYAITFTINDGCQNEYSETKYFVVKDRKQPTPVCYFGLATVVMPTSGNVEIWAKDFQASSYDNCTPYDQLQFSFTSELDEYGVVVEPNYVFSCDDIGDDGIVTVTIWVTDAELNQDFCTTFISVQDPNGACVTPTALITGEIVNEYDETVEEVTVKITDGAGMNESIVTQVDGQFQFSGMTNGSYDVTPEKDINYLNGVTTYDLVLISKHILGTEVFDTPYKWIAADANKSETITTLDIVKLRALILHIDDELSANDSWRFVDQDYEFAATANGVTPLTQDFPEYKGIQMAGTTVPANFVAVKIGDVNGTSSVNSLLGTDTRNFNGNLALQLDATKVAAGETFTVDFRANDFNNIAGYQFTLGYDNSKVDFVDVATKLEGLTTNNFGLTKLNEGMITTSWNANKGVSVDNDAVLFSMTFLANAAINTADLFEINSRYTASEAYGGSDLYNVVLEFNGAASAATGFELYQNTPNPFKAETQIGFNMPEAGAVSLTIYDVSGRVLRLIEMDAAKGFNSINVEREGLTATGVLYYQLETATETATKKMIIVD